MTFEVKGEPVTAPSGVNRGSEDGKVDYLLVYDGPMLQRWAELLTRAIPVRGRRNWMRAHGDEDLERFKRGAARHFKQWLDSLDGVEDGEDHAAAIFFNVNGAEYVKRQLAPTRSRRRRLTSRIRAAWADLHDAQRQPRS